MEKISIFLLEGKDKKNEGVFSIQNISFEDLCLSLKKTREAREILKNFQPDLFFKIQINFKIPESEKESCVFKDFLEQEVNIENTKIYFSEREVVFNIEHYKVILIFGSSEYVTAGNFRIEKN